MLAFFIVFQSLFPGEELLFWSKVINEWYEDNEAENLHIISIDSLVSLIQETTITESDLDWLHKLCYYFKNNGHADYLNKPIIPNEEYSLCIQKELVKPANFGNKMKAILRTLVPESVKKFVHSRFVDIVEEGSSNFGNVEACVALGSYFESLTLYDDSLRNSLIAGVPVDINQHSKKRISL